MVIINVLKHILLTIANLIKRVANWISARKIYVVCVGVILAELIGFVSIIPMEYPSKDSPFAFNIAFNTLSFFALKNPICSS